MVIMIARVASPWRRSCGPKKCNRIRVTSRLSDSRFPRELGGLRRGVRGEPIALFAFAVAFVVVVAAAAARVFGDRHFGNVLHSVIARRRAPPRRAPREGTLRALAAPP